jgi:peptide-methionine (S)-S-oxide reductase
MKFSVLLLALGLPLAFTNACTPSSTANATELASSNATAPAAAVETPAVIPAELAGLSRAYFAGGCFWCMETVFESIKGVESVISGYSGGTTRKPSYESVGGGRTGHAEAIAIFYDSTQIDFPSLLRVYLASIDPTQVNGQGPDNGTAYRSIIFYRNPTEKQASEQALAKIAGRYKSPLAVEVKAFETFWDAEDYHQDFVVNHPTQPYVVGESIPRRERTLREVPDLVKGAKKGTR